jgi:hypothetical protein
MLARFSLSFKAARALPGHRVWEGRKTVFMVSWEGIPPADKSEWIEAIRNVFAGATGTYRVRFRHGEHGWRFDLECRDDDLFEDLEVVANSPDTIRFNLVQALKEKGKPVDPDWRDSSPRPGPFR